MDILYPNLFHALFETDIPRIIIRVGHPELEILKCNQSFKSIKPLEDANIIGKNLWDIYDAIDDDRARKELLKEAIDKAIINHQTLKLEPFLLKSEHNYKQDAWCQLEIVPIADQQKVIGYVLVSAHDVTKEIVGNQRIQHNEIREKELNEELITTNEELLVSNEDLAKSNSELSAAIDDLHRTQEELKILNDSLEEKVKDRVIALIESENNMRSLIMNAHYPLMILKGKEGKVEIANAQALQLLSKSFEEIKGRSLADILPKVAGQPFIKSFKQTYATKKPFGEDEQVFKYQTSKGEEIKYISYYYDPLIRSNGFMSGIIVSANDITEKVKARKDLEKIYREQIELNNKIATINEELEATVEDLSASNEKLYKSQREIEIKNAALSESEERFRSLIAQAPVGICVVKADNFIVQEVNNDFLALTGRLRADMQDRSIWDAIPETAEVYAPIMADVTISGLAYKAKEREVVLFRNGVEENIYVDFVFEPVKDCKERVVCIMIVAIEITDKVLARQKIEDVEERIRLAIEATEMGTYDYNPITQKIITTPRLNKIFGLEEVNSREDLLAVLHPDDVIKSDNAHVKSRIDGKLFYEARLIHKDKSIHWIRVHGNLYFNEKGKPVRLLGTILDITEYKFLLQQKDDFISIASHELKTPITSLKASFQLLHRMKDNLSATLAPRLIEQSNKSMNRISELVEELLDVGRISEGSLRLNKKRFNLNLLLNECAQNIRANGNQQVVLIKDEQYEVYADEHRIEQVITNLINNAVKYATTSDKIQINIEQVGSYVRVLVKDNGPGVLPEKLPYLFERYYRADSSGCKVSGLGLGLYISKEIINKHGGSIGVESEVGKGSNFWFTIPIDNE